MSIRDNGGAVRYWRHRISRMRAVLCGNGRVLMLTQAGKRWTPTTLKPEHLTEESGWLTDTRPSLTSAVTRTTREARRRGDD